MTAVLPFPRLSHGKKTYLPGLSVSLTSHGEHCFICHLGRNEIKEMRGCHKRTSFLPEIIPLPSDIPQSNDRNRIIGTWCISPLTDERCSKLFIIKQNFKSGLAAHGGSEYKTRAITDTCLFSSINHMLPMINISLTKPRTCNIQQAEFCAAMAVKHFHVKDFKETHIRIQRPGARARDHISNCTAVNSPV